MNLISLNLTASKLVASLLILTAGAAAQGADDCSNAQPIAGLGPHAFDNTAATPSTTSVGCNQSPWDRNDVWFEWTAIRDARIWVSACAQTSVDVRLTVYQGAQCSPFYQVACVSSDCFVSTNWTFVARSGEPYRIRVASRYAGESGTGTFTLSESIPIHNPANGSDYELVPYAFDWNSARDEASMLVWGGRGGQLAAFSDAAERDWVLQNLPVGRAWTAARQDTLGPAYAEPDGGWVWLDGSPAQLPWLPGEPDDGTTASTAAEHYAVMTSTGLFEDVTSDGGAADGFLVEWTPGLGSNYCGSNVNSTGAAATTSLLGSAVVLDNDLTVLASGLPTGSFSMLLVSETQGFNPNPSGSAGNLCVVGSIGRFALPGQVQMASAAGGFSLHVNLFFIPSPGGAYAGEPGETRHFQLWYRDASGGTTTSNFSDGISILLQ